MAKKVNQSDVVIVDRHSRREKNINCFSFRWFKLDAFKIENAKKAYLVTLHLLSVTK